LKERIGIQKNHRVKEGNEQTKKQRLRGWKKGKQNEDRRKYTIKKEELRK
jgi:hypothetical protein